MRLTPRPLDLTAAVAAVMDDHLRTRDPAPVAVGLSGGGDSVALLLAAGAWAGAHGRPLLVLTVDHRLQSAGRDWTLACAARAQALGHGFRALAWSGDKPAHGLPAAARAARHRLLAQAAREAGAKVILLGHTADDVAEAGLMRQAGSTAPAPRVWGPSPVWPDGRGLFLLRPLLGLRRAQIRAWLTARGETWIEDPANADMTYARPRARAALARETDRSDPDLPPVAAPLPPVAHLARAARCDDAGVLTLERALLRDASADAARAFVSAACLCAAGTDRPPRGDRLDRLTNALRRDEAVTATLAGTRIEADAAAVRFLREPGELTRRGLPALPLVPGEPAVWDGRFEICATAPGLIVEPLAGRLAGLDRPARRALTAYRAKARPGLPGVWREGTLVGSPGLEAQPDLRITPLALARLHAACGLVRREPD